MTALRSKNLRQLTYRPDNTGHLRREGKFWVIEIPYKNFKNCTSSFFGTKKKKFPYRKTLQDQNGLYEKIEEYLSIHRPNLLKGTNSDIFFVATSKRPMFSKDKFHRRFRKVTARYIAHNPYLNRGIPGVKPFGPHAIRDIVATHVIKETGSFALAAYAIGDTEEIVREHYARFLPKDKTNMSDRVITSAWERDCWTQA